MKITNQRIDFYIEDEAARFFPSVEMQIACLHEIA